MTNSVFWLSVKHYLRRALRDPFGLGIFTVLPVVIVALISYVYTVNTDQDVMVNGYNMVTTRLSVGMMIYFQLNCGIYLMNFLEFDFLKPMKWRLRATPVPSQQLIYAGAVASTLFTSLQGLSIVLFTTFFMNAYWGHPLVAVAVVFLISMLSQMVSMILLLVIRKLGTAEMASWGIAWSMAVLGGLMFELPNTPVLNFMRRYGTPYSMAQTAIHESGFLGTTTQPVLTVALMLALLVLVIFLLSLVAIPLGRRKLL